MLLGRVGQEFDAGKLTEGLFVAFGSGGTGHAIIIDVWVTAEVDLDVLEVEGRFGCNVEGR
jgi:hypothetical protein